MMVLLAIPCRICGAEFVEVWVDEFAPLNLAPERETCAACRG